MVSQNQLYPWSPNSAQNAVETSGIDFEYKRSKVKVKVTSLASV